MLRKPLLYLCAGIILLNSCQKDLNIDSPQDDDTNNLSYFFDKFEKEAEIRGLDVDLSARQIEGFIAKLGEGEGVAGKCRYHSSRPNEIVVDQGIWEVSNTTTKELIVFHELGHCVLGRGHDEGINQDGTCKSIMRSGIMGCQDNYNTKTRNLYLDELFTIVSQDSQSGNK